MAKNSPNLMDTINPQVEESQETQRRRNIMKIRLRPIIILLKGPKKKKNPNKKMLYLYTCRILDKLTIANVDMDVG